MYIPRAEDSRVQRMVDGAAAGLRVVVRSLAERAESSSKDDPTPNDRMKTQNIGIALGVIIPIGGAIIVLTYLHRRHVKRQRAEDLNDPHKSLDFGLEGLGSMPPQTGKKSRKGKKGPEMIVTDLGGPTGHPSKRGHGMSLDLGVPSPYLLPAGMQSSKESLNSMSRSYDEHDPYRPVAMMRPSTDTDRFRHDDKGSVYSMSTRSAVPQDRASLIANARPMSVTPSKRSDPMSPGPSTPGDLSPRDSHSPISRARSPLAKSSVDETVVAEKQLQPLPSPPAVPEPVAMMMPPPRKSSTMPVPPRQDSMTIPQINRPESSNYDDTDFRASVMPSVVIDEPYDIDPSSIYADYSYDEPVDQAGLTLHAPQPRRLSVMAAGSRLSMVDAHRLSAAGGNRLSIMGAGNRLSVMGARPLPADMPEDNPEIRANRIRSFYKEYFDDSKPLPANAYYEDEYNNDLIDGVVYDPDSGGFYAPGGPMPYAQPPGRRAMTPPPRSKPRVSGPNSPLPFPGQHFRKFSSHSTMSGGRGPMGYGGPAGARGRPMVPAKKLPPPMPLQSLPTPHRLGQDVWISNPIDFAPPSSIRNVQNGARPDSPFGGARPYSPSVRAFTPLASSFDALAVLPSPHDLRKSGTFTALDFAPPSRMRDPAMLGGGSDAGSIRSNRSGISAMQHQAVRDGAYRVSRIPKEFVASREDLVGQLKPKMDMVSKA